MPALWPLQPVFYAFALGILYAYWREKSVSLLAPLLGHNVSDGVEYAFMFLMTSPPLLPRYRASIPGFDMFPPEPPFVD